MSAARSPLLTLPKLFERRLTSAAISSTCFFVTLPTFVVFGVPLPLGMPAALRSSTAAGGLFSSKSNERSV